MKLAKRLLRTCLALLLVIFSLSSGMVVGAKGKAKLAPETLWVGTENYTVSYQNMSDDERFESTLVSVKSDNSKVIKVVENKGGDSQDIVYGFTLTAVKPGKAKITVVYQYKGKEITLSATYTVKKNPKPFSSISIGGKKLNLKKNPYNCIIWTAKRKKQSVDVKLNKGWKIKKIYVYDENGEYWKVKNGGSVKFGAYDIIHIVAVNKKKVTFDYRIDVKEE